MSEADRSPLQVTRRARLLQAVRRDGSVRVSDLTRELGVTAVTVRRDIVQLADQGLVRKVHGGATRIEPAPGAEAAAARTREVPGGMHRRRVATRDVGMLVPSIDFYWPDVVRGAERAARDRGLNLQLRGMSYESDDDWPQLERFMSRGTAVGLLVAPRVQSSTAAGTLERLAAAALPVVLVERQASVGPHHVPMESVVTDHALGAAMAVRHLAGLGHRKVGLVVDRASPTSPHVRRGWRDAAADVGFSTDTTVDVEVPKPGGPDWDDARLDDLLDQCRRTGTTALLVHADAQAIAVVQHCERRHLSVPGDLSVVAYDDAVASLFSPALSAVRPPRGAVGRAAVALLAARLADPGRPVHRLLISPALHVRESSGPPSGP